MSTGLAAFTLLHVLISLVGIFSGLVVLYGFLTAQRLNGWTTVFLATTVATSATGFLFPFERLLPSHITGIISLIVLAPTLYALYSRRLAGGWRGTYVIGSVVALHLNIFVLVVQLFLKIPALKALAPKQNEPPFAITQGIVFAAFAVMGIFSFKRFRPPTVETSKPSGSPVIIPQN